ncbi:hypothetical protein CRYUN_Cryun04dG0027500 [Craigia yunnanensis]
MSDQLLNKQNSSNEIALDMDLDMDDLKQDQSVISRDSRRVSFETGVSSFQIKGNGPTRSPQEVQMMSGLLGISGPIRSGLLVKGSDFDEEDDPFADEDVPDEFRRANLNALTLLQWTSDLRADAFPPPRSEKLQKTFTRLKTQKFSRTSSKKGDNGIGVEH